MRKVEVQKPRATGAKPSDGGSFFFSVARWTVHPQPRMKQQMSPKIRRRLGGHAPPPRLRPGSALRQVERQKLVATSTRANLLLRVVSVVLVSDSCAAQRPQRCRWPPIPRTFRIIAPVRPAIAWYPTMVRFRRRKVTGRSTYHPCLQRSHLISFAQSAGGSIPRR